MPKILSYRNIASVLFIATFVVFVMAEKYTKENGPKGQQLSGTELLINKSSKGITQTPAPVNSNNLVIE